MEAIGYLAAFLDCLSHFHYADMGDRCQLSCQRPHHSLQPPLITANQPLLLLKMQRTWITPQLSQLPGPNLIKQLGHLVNNHSPSKDKCGLNGVSHVAVQWMRGNLCQIRWGKRGQTFFLKQSDHVMLLFLLQTNPNGWDIKQDIGIITSKVNPELFAHCLQPLANWQSELGNVGWQTSAQICTSAILLFFRPHFQVVRK